jgi:manganese/zinc/iron transport system permease protein
MDNPYTGHSFFSVIGLFITRFLELLSGKIAFADLATDEVQVAVLASIGISSALVGAFLVFKKMTMLANSISHTILLGIIPAFLFSATLEMNLPVLLAASALAALLTAFFTQGLHQWTRLQEDASTGIVFTSLFAIGIVMATLLTRNSHIGAEAVMGNVDALHRNDLKGALLILFVNCTAVMLFYRPWQLIAFDSSYAKLMGFSVGAMNIVLLLLVSMTLVGAFRAVGVLMVLTFITAPALIARLYCRSLKPLLLLASGTALLSAIIGVALARHLLSVYDLPVSTGGLVVTLLGSAYLLCIGVKACQKRLQS